jgi:hypothetical protein
MAKFTNDEDVKKSLASMQDQSGLNLKIEEGKTPVYILEEDYFDGYVHWVSVGDRRFRVVCAGGIEGHGFAPETCKICAYVMSEYKRAKQLAKDGNDRESGKVKDSANEMRGKYEAMFVAAKGDMVLTKDSKGEKKLVSDFDDATVGILQMTQRQYEDLLATVKSDEYPHVKATSDLLNRAIVLDKQKRDSGGRKARYATIKFIPSRNQTPKPKVEYKKEDYDLESMFAIDLSEVDKVMSAMASDARDDVDYEEDVAGSPAEAPAVKSTASKSAVPETDEDFFDDEDAPAEAAPVKAGKAGKARTPETIKDETDF